MSKNQIFVTQPSLPPLDEFIPFLKEIWHNKILTNNGPYHQKFEQALCEYLGVKHLSLFANGTIALMAAFQALRVTGEVITTPYSFVATAHSLLWNNLKPVFVDIDSLTCNIDPKRIEEAITSETTAILPVHCYGTPCPTECIQQVADTYGLKVIYDSAHAFAVRVCDETILNCGDLSVLSFHATKVFNTFEGGAIICPDAKTKKRVDYLKNFGFANEVTVTAPGINGKMSEFNAAFGILQLKYIDEALARRRILETRYREGLDGVTGIKTLARQENTKYNSSYFPVFVTEEYPVSRDSLYENLKRHGLNARRYFYPLISDMPMYRNMPSAAKENLPVAQRISKQVLCLPIYPNLDFEDQGFVIQIIRELSEK